MCVIALFSRSLILGLESLLGNSWIQLYIPVRWDSPVSRGAAEVEVG